MNCIKVWNQQNIRINPTNRYVCITDMATASGKQSSDWTRLQKTQELEAALATMTGFPRDLLVVVEWDEIGNKATWAHPKLAIQFAQWCNPLFALQVSDWIDELLTTGVVTIKPMTTMQMIAAQALEIDRQQQRLDLIEQQQQLESERVNAIESLARQHDCEIDRIYSPNGHYYSVIGHAKKKGLAMPTKTAAKIGQRCSAYCKKNNIVIEKLNDPRYGTVGSYPEAIIDLFI